MSEDTKREEAPEEAPAAEPETPQAEVPAQDAPSAEAPAAQPIEAAPSSDKQEDEHEPQAESKASEPSEPEQEQGADEVAEPDEEPAASSEEASAPPAATSEPAPAPLFGELTSLTPETKGRWRSNLWVALLIGLVYLPFLGSAGLWDPWETHYGEVGRQIVERNDWISTWWGSLWQDAKGKMEGEPFFSKPIMLMWLMAFGIKVFGTNEWGIRIGVCLVSMLGVVSAYQMGRSVFSARAGAMMAAVLGLSPFYLMLGRQAQTDMPFVGLMTVGLMFFMMGAFGKDREELADKASYALCGVWTLLLTVPQGFLVLVGLSRWRGGANALMNQLAVPAQRGVWLGLALLIISGALLVQAIRAGADGSKAGQLRRLKLGVASAASLWGPMALILIGALFSGPMSQLGKNLYGWFVWGPTQAALYMTCVGVAAWLVAVNPMWQRRRLYMMMFYGFIGLATLAKGLLGFMLPGAILFFYLLITREWRLLKQVELGKGIAVFIAVAFPWYAAMLIRHTWGFWNRFFVHDHFKRLASGVHAVDEGSFEHFIRWLGYGLFPWSALVPAALARLVARPSTMSSDDDRGRATLMLVLWAAIAFTLFTLSSTKFHHYIFPVVPPLALLVGLALSEVFEEVELPAAWPLWVVAPGFAVMIGWDAMADPQVFKNLFTYKYDRSWDSEIWDGAFRQALMWMMVPGIVGMCVLPMRNRVARQSALIALMVSALCLAYYLLNPYMSRYSEGWSQKQHWDRYYELCEPAGPKRPSRYRPACKEPVAAFMLNWRGENFYSGNEAAALREADDLGHFVSQLEPNQTFYVIMEMARWRTQFPQALPAHLKGKACMVYNRNGKFLLAKVPCAPDDPARVSEVVPKDLATFSAPGVPPGSEPAEAPVKPAPR